MATVQTAILTRSDFFNLQSDIIGIGPNYPMNNAHATEANRITPELIRQFPGGIKSKTEYAAAGGSGPMYIPVVRDTANEMGVALPKAVDLEIIGVVVAGDTGIPGTATFESPGYDPEAITNAKTINVVSVRFRGCGLAVISPYTGTAPNPASATQQLRYVCSSATDGSVATPSTAAIAADAGMKVIAVNTTDSLVAYLL